MIPPSGQSTETAADLSGSSSQPTSPSDGLIADARGLFTFPNRVLFGAGRGLLCRPS